VYHAYIMHEGKRLTLGYFQEIDAAIQARRKAENGDFNIPETRKRRTSEEMRALALKPKAPPVDPNAIKVIPGMEMPKIGVSLHKHGDEWVAVNMDERSIAGRYTDFYEALEKTGLCWPHSTCEHR
jgi:hypothetical protein